MPLMTWKDDMSVGISSIDEQHKKLVNMINELSDGMKIGKGREVLGTILDELIDYTAKHFKYEEELFDKTHYLDAFNHKKEHADLVKRVLDIQAKYKAGALTLSLEVMDFLKDWLVKHIMGSDKKYSSHLCAQGVK
ncbi:MAG: bacteriohemerythrin [Alphaproteobacteria bacterium]|nr:bacteriohemerythrin [Alphaproteobacteria bacterium]